jgi:hypothetical protein
LIERLDKKNLIKEKFFFTMKVEQEERLRVKDEDERQKMEELRAKAKKELDDW